MREVKSEYPPNIKEIAARFPGARGHGVIFAYAPYIYAPHHKPGGIPPELLAHEEVHIVRQEKMGVKKWWAVYLTNDQFRYVEELLAHRAEYEFLSKLSRQVRRSALKVVADKLAAPLYGRLVTRDQAIYFLTVENLEGCPDCHGLGVNFKAEDLGPAECSKCTGSGYVEGKEAA